MTGTNNIAARAAFEQARRTFFRAMRDKFVTDQECQNWVDGLKLSQGEVRLEVELAANSTNFKFGLTQNQPNSTGVLFNTENRLNMQDTLLCNELAIFVCAPSSRTDTTFKLRTYGNPVDFTAGAADAIDTTMYSNGYMRIGVNNDVIVPYRGLLNHWYKPQTQQTAALGAGSPDDQLRGAEDAFITEEPNILLIGSKGYVPEIILPAALATVDAFSRIVLIGRGILAQNSTVVS